jgi:hypothetical protein
MQATDKRITKRQNNVLFSALKTNAGTRVERNARRDDGVGGVRELRVCMQELESKALIDKKMVEGELTGD